MGMLLQVSENLLLVNNRIREPFSTHPDPTNIVRRPHTSSEMGSRSYSKLLPRINTWPLTISSPSELVWGFFPNFTVRSPSSSATIVYIVAGRVSSQQTQAYRLLQPWGSRLFNSDNKTGGDKLCCCCPRSRTKEE